MRRLGHHCVAALLLALSAFLVAEVPSSGGSSWSQIMHTVGRVRVEWLAVIIIVWWAGLWAYSFVLTASLPGLSCRQALGLNLAGSAVANAVPLGGAVSLGVTSAMVMSWGFTSEALSVSLTVSNIWNVLGRVIAGVAGLAWLAFMHPEMRGGAACVWATTGAAGSLLLTAAALSHKRGFARLGGFAGRAVDYVRILGGREAGRGPVVWALRAMRLRHQVLRVVARSWSRLSAGMVVYFGLLCLLMDLCLRSIGAPQPLALVAAAVGVERLVTAVPLTPGGSGVAELTLVACLTAAGTSPVDTVTATLMYRLFTFFLEIPVGFVVAFGWNLGRRRTAGASLALATGGVPGGDIA
jgi:putative heme transporter